LVYLNLKYPDLYFFYKYKMFKSFCEKIEYDYKPDLRSKSANVLQFLNLCTLLRDELLADNELLKLHKNRLKETEYFDASGNILTQDFIYAVTRHLTLGEETFSAIKPTLTRINIAFDVFPKQYQFTGKYIDHISQHKRNKHLGDIGEEIVLKHEQDHCLPQFVNRIINSSKSEGDGLGYDILSCDETGRKKYIEVKTTRGPASKSFYISGTELERSKKEGENYFLYRLYNLDEKNMTADFLILQGDLSKYCINPTEYEVLPTLLSEANEIDKERQVQYEG